MRFLSALVLAVVYLGATAATVAPPREMMDHVQTLFAITESRSDVNPDTLFTANGVVIDESAPFIWRGPHAASQWVTHIKSIFVANKIKGFKTSLGAPVEYVQQQDDAYLILPLNLSAQMSAKPFSETGTMTFTFHNVFGDWKISSAVWTTGK